MDNDLDNPDQSTPKKTVKPQQPPDKVTPTKPFGDKRSNVPKDDNDGDEYDAENGFRGYGRDFPPSYTMYEKMSKETAEYRQGAPFGNCGKCNYYISNHCKIVRGYIVQSMVCKYFSEKYSGLSISVKRIK